MSRVIRAARSQPTVRAVWHHVPNKTLSTRAKIARHYQYALETAFNNRTITHVVIFEDDLHLAPDTLAYLYASLPYLQGADAYSVVCASAWNDNGRASLPGAASLTSFFPGLGWALSRPLWHALEHQWPGSDSASSSLVTIGWDFWLRRVFAQNDWLCLTPSPSRTRHTSTGANVDNHQRDTLYAAFVTPPATHDANAWRKTISQVIDPAVLTKRVQQRLDSGRLVASVAEAVAHAKHQPILPYRREEYAAIANKLLLWPTPRGHFRYTLFVTLPGAPGHDILLFDRRRAVQTFRLPTPAEAVPDIVLRAPQNESCATACAAHGLACSSAGIESLNDCDSLQRLFRNACEECAFETGPDLPAFVVPDAPLDTKGACLITETGFSSSGRLDCNGRFAWTQRACACVAKPKEYDEIVKDEL